MSMATGGGMSGPGQQRCQCVTCGTCGGFGRIDDPFDYSGFPADTCDDCDGSGITEVCAYCEDQEELTA